MDNQYTLQFALDEKMLFDNFFEGSNGVVVEQLKALCGPESQVPVVTLSGVYGSGRTHLMQACCHAMNHAGLTSMYIPLEQFESFGPQLLEGLEHLDLLAIDQIDGVAGQAEWEEALFYLYNRCVASSSRLLWSTGPSLRGIPWGLEDLASRIHQSLCLCVEELNDQEKVEALQWRAERRGLKLSDQVAQYLFNHYPREMHTLFGLLDRLDQAAWSKEHELTIPFIKKMLG